MVEKDIIAGKATVFHAPSVPDQPTWKKTGAAAAQRRNSRVRKQVGALVEHGAVLARSARAVE